MTTWHPWIFTWALCSMVVSGAAAWAAARQSLPATTYRARHANEARRTAYSRTYATRGGGEHIPAPRRALDHSTEPIDVTTPTDSYAQHHATEIDAALGCTCSPRVGGTPTMDHYTFSEHTISTEYELTWETANAVNEPIAKTMIFRGESAEQDAYDIAELLAATDGGWTMRTRTVDTHVTGAPWIDVARYVTLDTTEPSEHGSGHDAALQPSHYADPDEPVGNVHGPYGTA